MVTYGQWVQPPDFTRSVTGYGAFATSSSESEIKNVYAFVHSFLDGEYSETAAPGRIDNVLGAVTQADPTYDGIQYPWPNLGSAVVKVAFSAPTGTVNPVNAQPMPPFIEDEWAEVNLVPQVFSAYDVNGWLPPAAPPGAIGVEIEGQPAGTNAVRANITQATLTATAYHSNVDATTDVQLEATGLSWTTTWMAGRGTFNGTQLAYYNGLYDRMGPGVLTLHGKVQHGSTENVEVDVTEHVSAMGELVLTKRVLANSISLADLTGQDEAGFGTTLISPTITYTFHPPRYRWIYDTPGRRGTTPPLRLTQRGDGLTGGAPRLLGRNSQQSTNRLGGGYF